MAQVRSSAEDFLKPLTYTHNHHPQPHPQPVVLRSSFLSLVLQDSRPPGVVEGMGLGVEELNRMRNFTKLTFTFLGSVFHPGDLVIPRCSHSQRTIPCVLPREETVNGKSMAGTVDHFCLQDWLVVQTKS